MAEFDQRANVQALLHLELRALDQTAQLLLPLGPGTAAEKDPDEEGRLAQVPKHANFRILSRFSQPLSSASNAALKGFPAVLVVSAGDDSEELVEDGCSRVPGEQESIGDESEREEGCLEAADVAEKLHRRINFARMDALEFAEYDLIITVQGAFCRG